ncbi:hypothetical protein BDY19DRAFT_901982 [Irpex rosettiformis]|uniref:Uncharacterized protein n=1 Tax=Irpex rosettiformis TaxID=378272 RepID=A0ACB8UKL9_9APHY|nr:hypothetical protein BDY19DRAFT_901982 [Irpex rosettiformis]
MPLNGLSPTTSSPPENDAMGPDQTVTDRKKKNADAQAAFRARRANYIATLEETVTNLEAVVIQLQESCRASKSETDKLRIENNRLRNEARDREKFWRALWQTKKTGMPPDPTDDSALPSYAQIHSSPVSTPSRMASVSPSHYDTRMRFPGDASSSLSGYNGGPPPDYPQRSPALEYPSVNGNGSVITRPPSVTGYAPYAPYTMEGSSPADDTWQQSALHPPTDHTALDGSQSPTTYVESPTLTSSDIPYPNQYGGVVDDAKLANGTPYMYPNSRSISPASTPTSTSSTSLAPAPYHFNFPENPVIPDFRRPMGPRELTLHGGTADVPIAGSVGDTLRYRLAATRANSIPNPNLIPAPYSRAENTSDDRGSDGSDSTSNKDGRPSRRPSAPTASSSRTSRSPSPAPHISGTLAVIKAQAFGALRRSRGRTRKSSEGAAKAAVDALSARGLGLGISLGTNSNPNKRPRRDDDDDDDDILS